MYVIELAPLGGQIVIEVNHNVARAILDRLLGGSGIVAHQQREMTEIELALLKTVGGFLATSLRDAWSGVVELQPTLGEPALSPEFVQVTLASETTVMLVFEISLLKTTGTVSVCLPHPVLQPVMDKITAQVWSNASSQTITSDSRLDVDRELTPVPLDVSVGLGNASLTVRELMRLAEGQVIKLDLLANSSLPIRIGDGPKFWGRPGLMGKNLAVQLTNSPEQEGARAR
jgi:flagellar motor switch protein FliM